MEKVRAQRALQSRKVVAEGEELGSNLLRVAQVFQQTQRIRFVGGEKSLAAGFWPHGPNSRRQTGDGLDEVVPVRLKKMRQKKIRAPFSFNQNRSCSNGPIARCAGRQPSLNLAKALWSSLRQSAFAEVDFSERSCAARNLGLEAARC